MFGLKVAKCVLRLFTKNIKFYQWQHPPDRRRLLGMYLDKAFSGCPLFVIIYMISEDIYQNYYLKIKMLIDWLVGHSKPDDFCALAQWNCTWILTLDFFQISNGKSEKSLSSLKIQMRFQKGFDPIVQCLPCLLEFLCPANLPNH